MTGSTTLNYELTTNPNPVQVSTNDGLSFTTLQIAVSPLHRSGAVKLAKIVVAIPSDPVPAGGPSTPDPANLAATPPTVDAVTITFSGGGTWDRVAGISPGTFLFTPPGGTPVDVEGQSLSITVARIQVNSLVGTAMVRISEWIGDDIPAPTTPATGSLLVPVPKFFGSFTLDFFKADPIQVDPSLDPTCSTTLSWSGGEADYEIQYLGNSIVHPAGQPDSKLPQAGSYQVTGLQEETVPFTLIARAPGIGQPFQRQVTVTVLLPEINSFTGLPLTVDLGKTCNLSWQTNGQRCQIDPGAITVDAPNGSRPITINRTQTVTLTAFRGTLPAQKTLAINLAPPTIDSFTVTIPPDFGSLGDDPSSVAVHLQWATRNGTVAITHIGQNLPATGTRIMLFEAATTITYTLTCTGPEGLVTQDQTVDVPGDDRTATS